MGGGGGGDVIGNGGGGLCFGKECSTLTEMGLKPKYPNETFTSIDPVTAKELERIINKLPFGSAAGNVLKRALGNGETYISLEIADEQKLLAIKQKYAKYLNSINSIVDVKNLTIFAFSRVDVINIAFSQLYDPKDQTYLLPDFFKLSPTQQAKILIHEANVRGQYHGDFERALQLDSLIEEALQFSDLAHFHGEFRYDLWSDLVTHFFRFLYIHPWQIDLAGWLKWHNTKTGLVLRFNEICSSIDSYSCDFDKKAAQIHYNLLPAFVRFLSDTSQSMRFYKDYQILKSGPYYQEVANFCFQNKLLDQTIGVVVVPFRVDHHFLMAAVNCAAINNSQENSIGYLIR